MAISKWTVFGSHINWRSITIKHVLLITLSPTTILFCPIRSLFSFARVLHKEISICKKANTNTFRLISFWGLIFIFPTTFPSLLYRGQISLPFPWRVSQVTTSYFSFSFNFLNYTTPDKGGKFLKKQVRVTVYLYLQAYTKFSYVCYLPK